MVINKKFLQIARDAFCPFSPRSGTEHMAPFLYSLVRLTRPRTIVEYGSGYTTLFLLAALSENAADAKEESMLLREKTVALGDLGSLNLNSAGSVIGEWFGNGGKACAVDPAYYLDEHIPHLYSFEEEDGSHEYTQRMKSVVDELEFANWFSHLSGTRFSIEALPADALPIDLAWNDAQHYKEFFDTVWPVLNPRGGMMVFHNTVSRKYAWDSIQWMKARRSLANDLEVITLPESHKLDQSSCTILRRTTEYQPPCVTRQPEDILHNAIRFMNRK